MPPPGCGAKESQSRHLETRRTRKKEPAGRKIEYTAVKPGFFVLSGMQGLKKFYMRGQYKGDEVRILAILYDQATEGTVEPVVIAISSAFNPFPTSAQIAGPPPRRTGTGVVVSDDGAISFSKPMASTPLADRTMRRLRRCR